MDIFSSIFEQKLLTISETFIYKVPPLRTASGHRAEDWGLDKPLFTGCLRVFQADTKLRIVLYSFKDASTRSVADDNLILFAECPIEVKPKEDITGFVDAVIDSSRYYVLRVQDPKSARSTLIGVGFRDRESAFDLKSVLNDYVRYVDRMSIAAGTGSSSTEHNSNSDEEEESSTSTSALSAPLRDLSLKEGQKITIKTKAVSKPKVQTHATHPSIFPPAPGRLAPPASASASASAVLAPPVSASAAAASAPASASIAAPLESDPSDPSLHSDSSMATASQPAADEDWGDFEVA